MSQSQHEIQLSGGFKRSIARLLSFTVDNPYFHLNVLMSGLNVMKVRPFYGFSYLLLGGLLLATYFYLARKGTTLIKFMFGMQIVDQKTGAPTGVVKMFFRDFVVTIMSGLYAIYFLLLLMNIAKPSTARNRVEEKLEDIERGLAAAAAVGSVNWILSSGALFFHDKWFQTTSINQSWGNLKDQVLGQNKKNRVTVDKVQEDRLNVKKGA